LTPSYAHVVFDVVFSCECERSVELKGMRGMESSDIVKTLNQIDSTHLSDDPHDGTRFGSLLTNVQNTVLAKRMFKFFHILSTDRRARE
jgi:hypothetical protein